MIEKITRVEKFAVFKSFEWDSCVCDRDGNHLHFKKLNIIYGRNYSGKTTLSRIARALETGTVDEKFNSPNYTVQFADGSSIDQAAPCSHGRVIRVFNEDFVKENLQFIVDPDEDVKAFAILGKDNNKLEAEIESLEDQLGSEVDGEETGLYAKRVLAAAKLKAANDSVDLAEKAITNRLTNKATKGSNSIRYQSGIYGDQNYNITKLGKDIETVLDPNFIVVEKDEQSKLRAILKEETRPEIATQECPSIDIESLISEVSSVVTREISCSSKIEEFVKDAVLNQWASEGRRIHGDNPTSCKFCGNVIATERWKAIESHFDKESDKLEKDIASLETRIKAARRLIDERERFDSSIFYIQFQREVDEIEKRAGKAVRACRTTLSQLSAALENRRKNTLSVMRAPVCENPMSVLLSCYEEFDRLRTEANGVSGTLRKDQEKAMASLRLATVSEFVHEIDYPDQVEQIRELKADASAAEKAHRTTMQSIASKQRLIAEKKRQLNDEEQGAIRVNNLLNGFFGNRYLSLEAVEKSDDEGIGHIRFEVVRNGEKAYHLSEGERSLLAFCYFMAKLEEVETSGAKPIVWIDDPISSLDGNHIFFVYSLINEHLHKTVECAQLFISTHSLDFLKYLRRLPGAIQDKNTAERNLKCRYLTIERRDDASILAPMPKYMQEYVTEFNYLFDQIYHCATATEVTDANYRDFYSFGNNARKFLEIYLYYAYPDQSSDKDKLNRFFGDLGIPAILVDRVNNEYSHMAGVFERGSIPVVQPEMQSCAKLICDRLSQNADQYRSLLRSIGRENDLDVPETTEQQCSVAAE